MATLKALAFIEIENMDLSGDNSTHCSKGEFNRCWNRECSTLLRGTAQELRSAQKVGASAVV